MNLRQLKSATMAGLLFLSFFRVFPIYIAAFFSVYVGLALLIPAYVAHRYVKAYFGYHLWKFKELSDIKDFQPLPKILVPKSNSEIDISWVEDLTPDAQLWLKENCVEGALVTNYKYANAAVIDTMYFESKYQRTKTVAAHKQFLATKE